MTSFFFVLQTPTISVILFFPFCNVFQRRLGYVFWFCMNRATVRDLCKGALQHVFVPGESNQVREFSARVWVQQISSSQNLGHESKITYLGYFGVRKLQVLVQDQQFFLVQGRVRFQPSPSPKTQNCPILWIFPTKSKQSNQVKSNLKKNCGR